MFEKMTLKIKLLAAFLAVGLVPFLIISVYTYWQSSSALTHSVQAALSAARNLKKGALELHFTNREHQLNNIANLIGTLQREAMAKLQGVHTVKKQRVEAFFHERFTDVGLFTKDRTVMTALVKCSEAFQAEGRKTGGPKWTETADKSGGYLENIVKTAGYYDLLLIDREGNVVCSVAKERDLGQNLFTGELKETALAKGVQKIITTGRDTLMDCERYAPSNNKPSLFVGGIIKSDTTVLGVLIFQIDIEAMNALVADATGLGKSGEAYIVGSDKRMRSNSRQDATNRSVEASFAGTIEKNGVDSEGYRRAMAGETGVDIILDYRGKDVVGTFSPLEIQDVKWVLLTEIDMEEAYVPLNIDGQDYLGQYREVFGLTDLYLVNKAGFCFYSATKGSDYNTNILTGAYRNTHLARGLRKAAETRKPFLADFELYAAMGNVPYAFMIAPVIHKNEVELFVAIRFSGNSESKITQSVTGLGETAETYLVGPDKLMRTNSRWDTNRTIKNAFENPEKNKVDTEGVREALAGKTAFGIYQDYRGREVVSAYTTIDRMNVTWAVISEIGTADAFAPIAAIRWAIWLIFILGTFAIAGFALYLTNGVSGPISRIVLGLAGASEQVASASTQLSKASQEISEGASEQASTLEQVSSSLEELTSMTKQNADNSLEAEKLSSATKKSTQEGNNQMVAINSAMKEIGSSSEEMKKIIKSLQEITFQTNMLALNAAVEAARAGEHGRGFAVVAEEVRNLARKAAEFAKTTEALVFESADQVKEGMTQSEKTTAVFVEILEKANKLSELVAEVSAATQEQARGLNQITLSVTEMDKVVQGNAANAEEGASTSEELNSQAKSLEGMVRELAVIISGKGQAETALVAKHDTKKSATATKTTPHKAPMQRTATHTTNQPKAPTANAPMATKPMPRKNEVGKFPARPQDVIPLNEDEFKDF